MFGHFWRWRWSCDECGLFVSFAIHAKDIARDVEGNQDW